MASVRVLMVDDHLAVAQAVGLRIGVEPELHVLDHVNSLTAERAVERYLPDVAVVDDTAVDDDAVALVSRLRSRHPGLQVVLLMSDDDLARACAAVRAGALGLVGKDSNVEELIGAIHAVARHEGWIPARLLGGVLEHLRGEETTVGGPGAVMSQLTSRERDVLSLMVAGLSRAGIARRLNLSTNTVRTHVQNLLRKLKVHSSVEAVSVALRAGWNREATEDGWRPSPSPRSRGSE